jgi:hypothetical protein
MYPNRSSQESALLGILDGTSQQSQSHVVEIDMECLVPEMAASILMVPDRRRRFIVTGIN